MQLDFKDVLIRPRRSTLRSRSEVELASTFTFRHSKKTWTGVPIVAANMDTTGTFEMAAALGAHKVITALHKHYTVDQYKEWLAKPETAAILPYVAISSGSSDADLKKLDAVLALSPALNFVCLDVANGYSEAFVQCIREILIMRGGP